MGLLYILGATHMLMVEPLIMHTPRGVRVRGDASSCCGMLGLRVPAVPVGAAEAARALSWCRMSRKLNGTVAQVTLTPAGQATGITAPVSSCMSTSMRTRRCASRIRSRSAPRRMSRICGCRSSPAATGRSTCTRTCNRARGPSSTGRMGSSTTRPAATEADLDRRRHRHHAVPELDPRLAGRRARPRDRFLLHHHGAGGGALPG